MAAATQASEVRRYAGASLVVLLVVGCRTPASAPKQAQAIAVQPLGAASQAEVLAVSKSLTGTYTAKVVTLPSKPFPHAALYTPRNRYRADTLLTWLAKEPVGERVVGVSARDISTTNGKHADWGVFGLGQMPGTSCVVSSFRLGKRGSQLALERLGRVAIHEVGHTYGLDHCPASACIMSDAEGGIKSVDRGKAFCEKCRQSLGTALRS